MTVTVDDVLRIIDTQTDIEDSQRSRIEAMIPEAVAEFEAITGRKINDFVFTNVLLQDGVNCRIFGAALFLSGVFRDTYEITEIREKGVALTPVADYDDGNDFLLDRRIGVITRSGRDWPLDQFAVKISGKSRLGGQDGNKDVFKIIAEMVAAKTGLWKINTETENGTITTIRTTINKSVQNAIEKYKLGTF